MRIYINKGPLKMTPGNNSLQDVRDKLEYSKEISSLNKMHNNTKMYENLPL